MRELVSTPKFKRAFRKLVKRNSQLEPKLIQILQLMKEDVFARAISFSRGAKNGRIAANQLKSQQLNDITSKTATIDQTPKAVKQA